MTKKITSEIDADEINKARMYRDIGSLQAGSIQFLSEQIHETAVSKGWWDGDRNDGEWCRFNAFRAVRGVRSAQKARSGGRSSRP